MCYQLSYTLLMISANKTPEVLSDLIDAFKNQTFRAGTINHLHNSVIAGQRLQGMEVTREVEKTAGEAARVYYECIAEYLPKSNLYYADPHMCEVIEMAAAVMDSTDVADTNSLVSDFGFCYFAGGIPLTKDIVVHGMSWIKLGADKCLVGVYNDSYENLDATSIRHREFVFENTGNHITGRWTFLTMGTYINGETLKHTDLTSEQLQEQHLPIMGADNLLPNQIFHALMLLLNQPPQIVTLTRVDVTHKKQIKRLKKSKLPSDVVVIDMRHRYESKSKVASSGEKTFEYSRRWLVRGHWRWQPMKDRETGLPVRKRIWIDPHVKGPEDKPFIATKRVHALLK